MLRISFLIAFFICTLSNLYSNTIEQNHKEAIESNKGLLIKLNGQRENGTYWCGPCKLFYNGVESTPQFKQLLKNENLNYLVVNYPSPKLHSLDTYQSTYAHFFAKQYGFPTVILLNSNGIKDIMNGEKPSELDYRLIKSRTFLDLGYNIIINKEIEEAANELEIN